MITTARLTLIPARVELARAELGDRGEFARLLGATVPDNWPPESIVDALPMLLQWLEAAPDRVGWFGWYGLHQGDGTGSLVLVASGGFKGPPRDGTAEIGYSVLPQFQRRGYATEMVGGLVQWAFAHSEVATIVAETEWANPTSVRVLIKLGFALVGAITESEGMRYELTRGCEVNGVK